MSKENLEIKIEGYGHGNESKVFLNGKELRNVKSIQANLEAGKFNRYVIEVGIYPLDIIETLMPKEFIETGQVIIKNYFDGGREVNKSEILYCLKCKDYVKPYDAVNVAKKATDDWCFVCPKHRKPKDNLRLMMKDIMENRCGTPSY